MNIQKKLGLENAPSRAHTLQFKKLYHVLWACRGAVVLATLTSIWANWLHSEKDIWPIAINILPPILVLFGYELTSRTPLWEGPLWHPRRWVRPLAMVGITVIGAWLSYWHQKDAFMTYSKDPQTAMLLPLAIDGLMIISSIAVLDINDKIESLTHFIEAGAVTTYKPKAKEESKPKDKDKLSKKELISDVVARFPDMKPIDVAQATGSSLNYVTAIKKELAALHEQELVTA